MKMKSKRKKGNIMVDRKNVAVEKMDRAVQMLKENQIDMWMFQTESGSVTGTDVQYRYEERGPVRADGRRG